MATKNGFQFTGNVRGVHVRHRPAGKRQDGSTYDAFDEYTLIIEGDNFQDQRFRLTLEQQKLNWADTLQSIAGKRVVADCHYILRGEYLTWYLSEMPRVLEPTLATAGKSTLTKPAA